MVYVSASSPGTGQIIAIIIDENYAHVKEASIIIDVIEEPQHPNQGDFIFSYYYLTNIL